MSSLLKTFTITHKRGLLTLLKFLGVGLLIGTIVFASSGFGSWRAEKHQQKACNILYGIGNPLTEYSIYGEGINTVTPQISGRLLNAVEEAIAAGAADGRHYEAFADAVIFFDINLKGYATKFMENIHSPYALYTYAIYPACRHSMYLGDPNMWDFMRF